MAGKIFVNYRRDDSAAHALTVAQYLEREFGGANVFLDIDRMKAGQKFPVVLEERLSVSTVMVAVIGPHWLTLSNKKGERRIDDTDDWVRLEIARALARGVPVIPVLVGGASLPDKSELPDDLKPLVEHQVATITTNGFRNEMAGLARDIRDLQGGRGKLLPAAALAICLAAAIGVSIYAGVISLPKFSPSTTLAVAPVASTSIASDPVPQRSSEQDVGRVDEVQRKAEEEKSRKAAEEQLKAAEAETRRKADETERLRLADLAAEADRKRQEAEAEAARLRADAERRQKERADVERQRLANIQVEEEKKAALLTLDGGWTVTVCPRSKGCSQTTSCSPPYPVTIKDRSIVSSRGFTSGLPVIVSETGEFRINADNGVKYKGRINGDTGSGTFTNPETDEGYGCSGTISFRRAH